MSKHQIIRTESGEELVVLPRAEHDALLAAAGDEEAELRALKRIADDASGRIAAGDDFLLPDWLSDAIMRGETPIKAARQRLGLTQAAVATRLQITQGYLSEVESRRKMPSSDLAAKLAAALDVEPKHLLLEDQQTGDESEPGAAPSRTTS